jgi:hypothetical protein
VAANAGGRRSSAGLAWAIVAALVGIVAGLLLGDPLPGVAFGLGLLFGSVGSILVIPALRSVPPGLSGAAIDDAVSGWTEFHRELARARRFDSEFAIVRFPLDPPPDPAALVGLRNEIAASARRVDRLWIDEDHVLLLLPETSRAAAEAMLARIRAEAPATAAVQPRVAIFPEHGITSSALISAVYGGGAIEVPTPIGAVRPDLRPPLLTGLPVDGDGAPVASTHDVATQGG